MGSDLQFVNFSGDPSRNGAAQKLVRTHVMKKYRKQKRIEREARGQVEKNSRYCVPYHRTSHFSLPAETRKNSIELESFEEARKPSVETEYNSGLLPWSPVSVEQSGSSNDANNSSPESEARSYWDVQLRLFTMDSCLNAYNFLPIDASPRVIKLLYQNLTSTIRTSVHADPTGNYDSYTINDAARLYMTLSFAASRFEHGKASNSPENAHYFLSRSISAVKEDLEDSSKQGSDSMIATVASLANLENLNGRSNSAEVHMKGLQRMVELRGGLQALGMRGILMRMVLWSDLCHASRSSSTPRFPLIHFPNLLPLSTFTPQEFTAIYCLPLPQSLFSLDPAKHLHLHLHLSLLSILTQLHQLSTFLNLTPRPEQDLPQEAAYPDRVYLVEHQILTLLANYAIPSFSLNPDNEALVSESVIEILLRASLLYIYTNLRQTPVGGRLRQALVFELWSCLERVGMWRLGDVFAREMLWVVCVGVVGSVSTDEHASFLEHLRGFCTDLGLVGWEDVVDFCGCMPVLERACLERFRGICERYIGA
ncbi:Fungal specific transcription factor domain containing protein [Hyaloscypha variabilis]